MDFHSTTAQIRELASQSDNVRSPLGQPPVSQQDGSQPAKDSSRSIFPFKLWKMLNDPNLRSALHWSLDGKSFHVYEGPLKSMCLGKENQLFLTKKFKSFIRQLHLYGFKKINKNQFVHEFFVRDRPELLNFIRRDYRQSTNNSVSMVKKSKNKLPKENSPPIYKDATNKDMNCNGCSPPTIGQYSMPQSNLVTIEGNGNHLVHYHNPNVECDDHNLLTLYSNDIYPNTYYDNFITL